MSGRRTTTILVTKSRSICSQISRYCSERFTPGGDVISVATPSEAQTAISATSKDPSTHLRPPTLERRPSGRTPPVRFERGTYPCPLSRSTSSTCPALCPTGTPGGTAQQRQKSRRSSAGGQELPPPVRRVVDGRLGDPSPSGPLHHGTDPRRASRGRQRRSRCIPYGPLPPTLSAERIQHGRSVFFAAVRQGVSDPPQRLTHVNESVRW